MRTSSRNVGGHFSWNQWCAKYAPQPHEPEASEVTVNDGVATPTADIRDIPFQCLRNRFHQQNESPGPNKWVGLVLSGFRKDDHTAKERTTWLYYRTSEL